MFYTNMVIIINLAMLIGPVESCNVRRCIKINKTPYSYTSAHMFINGEDKIIRQSCRYKVVQYNITCKSGTQ